MTLEIVFNWEDNHVNYHNCFEQFCRDNNDIDIHDRNPFFYFIWDQGIRGLNQAILEQQWNNFLAENGVIIYGQ